MASILASAQRDPSIFIGGEVLAYGCGGHLGGGDDFVVEGDEYDTAWFDKVPKFWHYAPTHLAINNIEFDHADIYANLEEIIGVFVALVESMPKSGVIVYNADSANVCRVVAHAPCKAIGYSLDGADGSKAKYVSQSVSFHDGGVSFSIVDVSSQCQPIDVESHLTGRHNVYNLTCAAILARELGVDDAAILAGIAQYAGVKKRQEWIGAVDGIDVYDDFAHHPTAVRETVRAIRARYPERRIWGIFEMKSNTSRRAIFQHEYPEALAECDEVILSAPWKKDDLPPEMLIDIPRVAADLNARGVHARLIASVDDIVEVLSHELKSGDVVLGMSGSAFGDLHHKLLRALAATHRGESQDA